MLGWLDGIQQRRLLQWFGAGYVSHVVKSASTTNSVFALVLGMLAFLYLASTSIVVRAEINAVRVDRLHPRALLAPFTDNVELTSADRKTYTGRATAERAKGFQRVEVKRTPQAATNQVCRTRTTITQTSSCRGGKASVSVSCLHP